MNIRHRLNALMLFCLVAVCTIAQTLTLQVPRQVVQDKQFQLRFVLNTNDIDDFKLPEIDGLEILYGPSTSTSSSYQIINGKATSSNSVTLTYVAVARKAGSITIPAATAILGGRNIKSQPGKLEVLPPDQTAQSQGGGSRGGGHNVQAPRTQEQGEAITSQDLFIRVTASKKKVYQQEAILLTYKVYTLVSLTHLSGEMPDLVGCHTQEIELPQQKTFTMEHYEGRNYNTVVWRQYVVFPQQAGKIKIPAVKFEGTVRQRTRSMDPFDAFFGGGMLTQEVNKNIVAPSLEIDVEPLPTPKPENFCGAVGTFNISTSVSPQELKANEALTLRLVVSGTGNLKLVNTPKVDFPKDFETYDAKVTDKWRITREGASGNKVFDYIAVPRHQGDYDISPVEFCYFDTDKHEYRTLTSEPYHIKVEKGTGTYSVAVAPQQEELENLGDDIRFIKRGDTHPIPTDGGWWGSLSYIMTYVGCLLLFALLVLLFNKQIKANADIARKRGKQAGRVAAKRLKQAARLMKNHETGAFYEEIMRALWGYAADRLNMPVAELTKENVGEKLALRGTDSATIERFAQVLGDCEFARYAPGDPNENMSKIYAEAEDVINKL